MGLMWNLAKLPLKLLMLPMSIANYCAGAYVYSSKYQVLSIGGIVTQTDTDHIAKRAFKDGDHAVDKWWFGAGVLANIAWIALPAYWVYRKLRSPSTPKASDKCD